MIKISVCRFISPIICLSKMRCKWSKHIMQCWLRDEVETKSWLMENQVKLSCFSPVRVHLEILLVILTCTWSKSVKIWQRKDTWSWTLVQLNYKSFDLIKHLWTINQRQKAWLCFFVWTVPLRATSYMHQIFLSSSHVLPVADVTHVNSWQLFFWTRGDLDLSEGHVKSW